MSTQIATATAWDFKIPLTTSAEPLEQGDVCPELSSSVSTRDSGMDAHSIHSSYTPPRKFASKLQGLFHHTNDQQGNKRHSVPLFGKTRRSSSSGSTSPSGIPSLSEKYGSCKKGYVSEGATAVIRLVTKANCCSDVYCVKAFHKKQKDDSDRSYMKRMTSEFCISSTLRHENVVKTLDLVTDEKGRYCAVMEYVSYIFSAAPPDNAKFKLTHILVTLNFFSALVEICLKSSENAVSLMKNWLACSSNFSVACNTCMKVV